MKISISFLSFILGVYFYSCKKPGDINHSIIKNNADSTVVVAGAPPKTWQEHWPLHTSLLSLISYDQNVAIYYDGDMDPTLTYPQTYMSKVWAYVKKTYGAFGDSTRLYCILHQNKDFGGHPEYYYNATQDYRNSIDCGISDWSNPFDGNECMHLMIHETGHIVCGASHNAQGSPSDAIWGDSKFMEIYIYDVLMNIGEFDEAQKWNQKMIDQDPTKTFLGDIYPGTNWYVNWFFPIYNQYGKAALLNKYFELLAKYYPKQDGVYTRSINLGEFVHFWSGAAGVDLSGQAKKAFGSYWDADALRQFQQAKTDFPFLVY